MSYAKHQELILIETKMTKKMIEKILRVFYVALIATMLAVPASALLTDNEGTLSFWQRLFGSRQSVYGEQLISPGATISYKAMLDTGSIASGLCGNKPTVFLSWDIFRLDSFGGSIPATSEYMNIVSADSTTNKLAVGAYYGELRAKWILQGTYSIRAKFSCPYTSGATGLQSVYESLQNIKVASSCFDESSLSVGSRRCQSTLGGVTVQELQAVSGCKVWVSGQSCGTNTVCGLSSTNVITCIPQNQCTANSVQCLSTSTYRVCEYNNALVWSSSKNVPSGYECVNDGIKAKPSEPQDPCLVMNCNDNNPDTSDSCVSGGCINTPSCAEPKFWDGSKCVEPQQACTNIPDKPCVNAFWQTFPVCSWDSSTCTGQCPAVCVPVWKIADAAPPFCEQDACGSGCGADGLTAFVTKAECEVFISGGNGSGGCSLGEIEINGMCETIPSWVLPATIGIIFLLFAAGFGFYYFRRQGKK